MFAENTEPKTIEAWRNAYKELEKRNGTLFKEMMTAKARVYDLLYGDKEVNEQFLKSKVISLEQDIKNLVETVEDKNGRLKTLHAKVNELTQLVERLQKGGGGQC